MSKIVWKDRFFLWLAGLLLRISLGLSLREIPRRRPASPWKTLSFPPLLLKLTQNTLFFLRIKKSLSLTFCVARRQKGSYGSERLNQLI